MREIKFRGKSLLNGKWIYGYLHDAECGDNLMIQRNDLGSYGVKDETVGQYTGLKDRNGKEIYEGDILATDERVIGYVVGGVRGYCYDVNYINHPKGEKRWTLYETVTTDYPNKLAVVGNVFDNPELLKGGSNE